MAPKQPQTSVSNQNTADLAADWRAFEKAYPEVETLDCLFVDLCGTIRGKRYPVDEAGKVFSSGLQIPFTLYLLDARGAVRHLNLGYADAGRLAEQVLGACKTAAAVL